MKTTPRLFVPDDLAPAREIALAPQPSHYLAHVLRLAPGDAVRLFNGSDGEWLAYLVSLGKRAVTLRCERRTAEVQPPPDIDYVFAPLKHARLDYLVQKATELGVRRLRPVITQRTVAERVNLERMRANVIEAAEQCNLVYVPDVLAPERLDALLAGWDEGRSLVCCDEAGARRDPLGLLGALSTPAAVLVGPEGGFTEAERQDLLARPYVTAISLGPRIMRADTAAVAALTLVQAVLGDWHQ